MSKPLCRSTPVLLPKAVLALSLMLRMYLEYTMAVFSPGGSGILPMETKFCVDWQEEETAC